MLYRILKVLLGIGTRLYYREIRVTNKERLIQSGPTIIIANHPNTMLDAWIIARLSKRPIYYMAKGTFFSSRIKRWFLRGLGMIPVNRFEDAKTSGISNQAAFEECYQLLERGESLLIFPEGNSTLERQLRELRTGAARIALEAEVRNGGELGVQILPIGIIYVEGDKFRSSALLRIGELIDPMEYYEKYREKQSDTGRELTAIFRERLEGLLVNSSSKEQDDLVDSIVKIVEGDVLFRGAHGVEQRVDLIKLIHNKLNAVYLSEPWRLSEIEQLVSKISWQIETLGVDPKFLSAKLNRGIVFRQSVLIIAEFTIGFPVFVLGFVHNVFPFQVTSLIMPKLVKVAEYYAPIAILLGIVLYPLTYTSFLIAAHYLFDFSWWMLIIYFLLMPISGMIAFYFLKFLRQVSYKWKYLFLLRGKKNLLARLIADKTELGETFFG